MGESIFNVRLRGVKRLTTSMTLLVMLGLCAGAYAAVGGPKSSMMNEYANARAKGLSRLDAAATTMAVDKPTEKTVKVLNSYSNTEQEAAPNELILIFDPGGGRLGFFDGPVMGVLQTRQVCWIECE